MNNNKDIYIGLIVGFVLLCILIYFTTCIGNYQYEQNLNITHNDRCDFLSIFGIELNSTNDFYSPHYVKLHIIPEREGINISVKLNDECIKGDFPVTSGRTDNKSEVVFPMISTAKYNILIDNNRCSYYIYPRESEYVLECSK